MRRLELPGGRYAVLSDPGKVQERKRRRYSAALADLAAASSDLPRDAKKPDEPDRRYLRAEHMEMADRASDLLILALVKEWSFGEVTQAVLEELEADCFDPIFMACRDLSKDLMPDYSPDIDPKARTSVSTGPPPESPTEAPTFATVSSDGTSSPPSFT